VKGVSDDFSDHIAQEVTSVATKALITRRDGVVIALTSHTDDVEIDGVTYKAATGNSPSAITSTADLSVDNLEATILLDSEEITSEDLIAGLFDFATIEFAEFNYGDVSQGEMILRTGTVGETSLGAQSFTAELRGVMQPLQQTVGRIYQKRCDADLYDSRCGLVRDYFLQSATVVTVESRSRFTVTGLSGAEGWFDNGYVTWTTGENAGLQMEIKRWTNSPDTLELHFAMPFNVQAGDAFTTAPGCDLVLSTCRDKFNNVVNFRGFPHMPTRDAVLAYPNAPEG
jgi:uncharacterized phage protein (TIGR02218 family)